MLDKDKLILIVYVGVKGFDNDKAMHSINSVHSYLIRSFDDSVRFITVPSYQNNDIDIKELNTTNYTSEQLENILKESRELLNSYKQQN